MTTLQQQVQKRDNDYSHLERRFRSRTGQDLVRELPVALGEHRTERHVPHYNAGVSVVIPSYNGISDRSLMHVLTALTYQTYLQNKDNKFEVIVVDDGSTDNTEAILQSMDLPFHLKYVKQDNAGPSYARNAGLAIAEHDVIVFLDNDIVIGPHVIEEHARVHDVLDNVVVCGARKYVSPSDPYVALRSIIGNPAGVFGATAVSNPKDIISLSTCEEWRTPWWQETDSLKRPNVSFSPLLQKHFGPKGFVGLVPYGAITANLSVRRQHLYEVGGFKDFPGWGMEDIFLGTELFAHGLYIVPAPSALGLHIEHAVTGGSYGGDFLRDNAVNQQLYFSELQKTRMHPGTVLRTQPDVQQQSSFRTTKGRMTTYRATSRAVA